MLRVRLQEVSPIGVIAPLKLVGFLLPENAIQVVRGGTLTLHVLVYEETDPDALVDITLATLHFTVKEGISEKHPPRIYKVSTDPMQIDVHKPRHGEAKVMIASADTKTLEPRSHVYDLWLFLGGGRYPLISQGVFEVLPNIAVLP